MKPRNEEERLIQRLHDGLKDPSVKQVNWMIGQDKERILAEYRRTGRKVVNYSYYSIATTCRNWQVVRYYILHSECSRNGYTFGSLTECSQRWMLIDGDGRMHLHIFEKPKTMCWYCKSQPYNLDAELSLKGWSTEYRRGGRTEFIMADEECVPNRRIAPSMRNLACFIGRMDDIDLYSNYNGEKHLLETQRAHYAPISRKGCMKLTERSYLPVRGETLCRIGLTDCGLRYTSSPWMRRNIDRWWKPLLVANRHGFDWKQVKDIADWFDYCENLHYLGLDVHSPKYICPTDFNAAHGTMHIRANRLYIRRREERERQAQLERERRAEEQAKRDKEIVATYAGRMGALLGLVIAGKGITITPLQSVDEFMEEGKAMHHCVFANRYYAKDYALIMSARDEQGNRLETIEVNLKEFRIIQSRAVNNGTSDRHDDIVDLVNRKMPLIKQLDKQRKTKNKKVALSA